MFCCKNVEYIYTWKTNILNWISYLIDNQHVTIHNRFKATPALGRIFRLAVSTNLSASQKVICNTRLPPTHGALRMSNTPSLVTMKTNLLQRTTAVGLTLLGTAPAAGMEGNATIILMTELQSKAMAQEPGICLASMLTRIGGITMPFPTEETNAASGER